ncbi:HD-GYP domain-containing protein [Neobacillus sp. LXY-1]|uniref:HD-GYP domain-containing protein n=1 Tax=Neobacillus sp. LXY-1 TaxID=3379133 RepID=UPI003EE116E3
MKVSKGMILKDDIYSKSGILLLKKGTKLTAHYAEWLDKHQSQIIYRSELEQLQSKQNWTLNETIYKNVFSSIQDLQRNIGKKNTLEDHEIHEMMTEFDALYQDFVEKDIEILDIMANFSQDEYLFKHSINVGLVASKIGSILNLPETDQQMLARMGLFHDVGKFKIDPFILNKPSRLTDEEFELIKQHPTLGYDLLVSTSLSLDILEGVLKHHERLDGSGYPNRFTGEQLPLFVRILSVADTFDAICSVRVYKQPRTIFFAIEELIKDVNAKRLDESIVLPFTYYLMSLSKGMQISLRNGKMAEIMEVEPNYPNQPILRIEGFQPLNLIKENLTLLQVANL